MRNLSALRWGVFVAAALAGSQVPAVDYTWIDTVGSGNWSVAGNWTPAAPAGPPGSGDTANVTQSGHYILNLDVDATVDEFAMDSALATFLATGRTFTVQNAGNNAAIIDGKVILDGSTWAGAATLRLFLDGLLEVRGTSTISSPIQNFGPITINGGTGGAATLIVLNSFSSSGTIQFTSTGALANAAIGTVGGTAVLTNTGSIEFLAGAGGSRILGIDLTNSGGGTVQTDVPVFFTGSNLINNGTWNIASGVNQEFSGIDQSFTQSGGTLSLNGTSTLTVTGGDFTLSGGTIAGTGSVILSNGATLNLGAGGTGTIELRGGAGGGVVSGSPKAGHTLLVVGVNGTASSQVTGGSISNAGTIRLTSIGSAAAVGFFTPLLTDTITNTGTIEFLAGAGGTRTLHGNLTNSAGGTVQMDVPVTFGSDDMVNNGTWNIANGIAMALSGATTSFTQSGGTLTINGTSTLNVTGGDFTLSGGTIAGTGSVILSNGATLNLGAGGTGTIELRGGAGGGVVSGSPKVGHTLLVVGVNGTASSQVTGGSISNAGTIRLTSIGSAAAVGFFTPLLTDTITNTGTIEFLAGAGGTRTLHGNLTNSAGGTVQMDVPVTFGSDDMVNNGTWNIANGIAMALSGATTSFTQSGGTLTLNGSSTINVTGGMATLSGGTIAGTGELRVTSGTVVFGAGGTGAITARGTTTLQGNLASGHQLNLDGIVGTPAVVSFTGNLINSGTIDVSANLGASATLAVSGANGLINFGDLTFSGSGAGSASRTLQGRLSNTTTGVATIAENTSFNSAGADHTNSGLIMIDSGATLTVLGGAGTNFTNLSTGILRGGGTLNVTATDSGLANQGTVAPGLSPGILSVTGNYTQQAGGTLEIELGGPLAGDDFDVLNVTGNATLAGVLSVSLIDSFTPTSGQEFIVLSAGSIADNGLALGGPAASLFDLLFVGSNVVLRTIGLPGDFNGDDVVDAADYTVWRNNVSTNFNLGGNGNEMGASSGVVDEDDYILWKAHYGESLGGPGGGGIEAARAVVPEPMSLALSALGAIALLMWRSRARTGQNGSAI